MTKQYYKNLAFITTISTIWCVYMFFDYWTETGFVKLSLFFNYFVSIYFTSFVGLILIILRFTMYKNKSQNIKDNFFYVFSAISNLFLSILRFIWLIINKQSILEFIHSIDLYSIIIILSFFIGLVIEIDLHNSNKKI